MNVCRIEGHDKVSAKLLIAECGSTLSLDVLSAQRIAELGQALNRALNTWDTAPAWLVDLCDMCNHLEVEP